MSTHWLRLQSVPAKASAAFALLSAAVTSYLMVKEALRKPLPILPESITGSVTITGLGREEYEALVYGGEHQTIYFVEDGEPRKGSRDR